MPPLWMQGQSLDAPLLKGRHRVCLSRVACWKIGKAVYFAGFLDVSMPIFYGKSPRTRFPSATLPTPNMRAAMRMPRRWRCASA